jgi:Holliday junction resolvase RusA-like endonuclease
MNSPISPPELELDWPDSMLVRQQILQEYARHTGKSFIKKIPSVEELREVSAWMNHHAETLLPAMTKQRSVLTQVFFSSLSSKANSLAQFHCPICVSNQSEEPAWSIPIRISPISKQSASQTRTKGKVGAFERAIASGLARRGPWLAPGESVCLLILFVVHPTTNQKDLDNMSKAIVDAIKNILFGDDRRIDHLNLIRLKAPDEEYVWINLRKSDLNNHSNVLFPGVHHSWAGTQVLDLADFM